MHDIIRNLKILYNVLLAGVLFILMILHFFVKPIDFDHLREFRIWGIIGLSYMIFVTILSYILFKRKISKVNEEGLITEEEWNLIRQAYVLRWSLVEGGIFLNIILYFFVSYEPILMLAALGGFFVLYLAKPEF